MRPRVDPPYSAAGTASLSPQQVEQLNGLMEGIIDDTMEAIFVKGYSRDTEFEADKLAVDIVVASGYSPHGLLAFLQTLEKSQETGSGGVFTTHPKASDRIAKVQEELATQGVTKAAKTPKARSERFASLTKSIRK